MPNAYAWHTAVVYPGIIGSREARFRGIFNTAIHLKTVRFGDGTGSIGIAPGWNLDDQKRDSIIISGPDGASLRLGQYGSTIQRSAAQFGAEQYFTVIDDLSNPVAATQAYIEQASRRAGRPLRLRVLEVKPVNGGGGMKSVMMHYLIEGADRPEGYGFFAAGPVGSGMGQLYSSFAVSSPAAFKKGFVPMLAKWRSKKTHFAARAFTELPAEMVERMETMKEQAKEVHKLL